MCGRYNLVTDAQALVDFFEVTFGADMAFTSRYNIAPTQFLPIIRDQGRGRELLSARWGLVPHWSKEPNTKYSTINARAETVAQKPAYRDSFQRRRCLVPATGFYEWAVGEHGKQPYYIGLQGGGLMAFAGIWDHWSGEGSKFDSYSIVVTAADGSMEGLHDRMPVMLLPEHYTLWLTGAVNVAADLMQPHGQTLDNYPVGQRVNSPVYDDLACLQRL